MGKKITLTLELTELQAAILKDALELYFRVGLGQLNQVTSVLLPMRQEKYLKEDVHDNYLEIREAFVEAKRLLFGFGHGESHGIFSPHLPDRFKVAADIHDSVRSKLAWHKNPGGGFTVDFDPPAHFGSEPFPTVTIKEVPDV